MSGFAADVYVFFVCQCSLAFDVDELSVTSYGSVLVFRENLAIRDVFLLVFCRFVSAFVAVLCWMFILNYEVECCPTTVSCNVDSYFWFCSSVKVVEMLWEMFFAISVELRMIKN